MLLVSEIRGTSFAKAGRVHRLSSTKEALVSCPRAAHSVLVSKASNEVGSVDSFAVQPAHSPIMPRKTLVDCNFCSKGLYF